VKGGAERWETPESQNGKKKLRKNGAQGLEIPD
jgi:hypothetical protein